MTINNYMHMHTQVTLSFCNKTYVKRIERISFTRSKNFFLESGVVNKYFHRRFCFWDDFLVTPPYE